MSTFNLKSKKATILIVVAITVVVITVIGMSIFAINYINEARYQERKTYLETQVNTTTILSNKLIARYQSYAQTNAVIIQNSNISDLDVIDYLVENKDSFFIENSDLILVDNSLNYYKTDGSTARITSPENYTTDTLGTLMYMAHHPEDESDSIVFRVRLEEPKETTYNGRNITISYCALVYYMDGFEREINSMFPFLGNRFIIDRDGFMIYKNMQLGLLINGSNIYTKYDEVDFLHGVDGSRLKNEVKARKSTIGEFTLNNKNYFICTSPLAYNGWSIVFIIKSDFLESGSYINTVFKYVIGIAIIFTIITVCLFVLIKFLEDKERMLEFERNTNAKLEHVTRAKSDFLANMSHDIRTPINGIIGMTLLAKKQDNSEKTNSCLDNIERSSSHLLSLINDILDMSSIESGKVQLVTKPVNLHMVADECASIIRGQILNRSLQFNVELCEPFSWVYADSLRLRQILINILSNAVKYTLDDGSILFSMDLVSEDENSCTVKFVVEDTGIGMKPEFIDKIFDAFTQEEGGSRTTYVGTGLGMAITKSYVDMMGGTISVESELYEGSKFTVVIPFEKAPHEQPVHITASDKQSLDGVKILLVEDNEVNMLVASELLEDEKAVITKAYNGVDALETFTKSSPGDFDVILMDIMMPEMNGLDCAKAIRALDRPDAKTIPIIAMTANAFNSDIENSKAAGMNAHLSKPINLREVISTVNTFVKKEGIDT